jgi:antitoxin HigA-1
MPSKKPSRDNTAGDEPKLDVDSGTITRKAKQEKPDAKPESLSSELFIRLKGAARGGQPETTIRMRPAPTQQAVESAFRDPEAQSLIAEGLELHDFGRHVEEQIIWVKLINQFPAVYPTIVSMLSEEAVRLNDQGCYDEAIAACDRCDALIMAIDPVPTLAPALLDSMAAVWTVRSDIANHFESKDSSAYTGAMSRPESRDALETKLDQLKREYELSLGTEAAKEAFARRASAGGDGILDPDMGARGLLKQASAEATAKEPVHPGVLMKTLIDEKGLTVIEAAALLGVTRQQLYNVFATVSDVTAEMAWRFEKAFGTPAMDWLNMQSEYSLREVRARGDSSKPKRIRRASRLVRQQP